MGDDVEGGGDGGDDVISSTSPKLKLKKKEYKKEKINK